MPPNRDVGFYAQDREGVWLVRPPGAPKAVRLSKSHTVVEHADGTITVSPSLLILPGSFGLDPEYGWHGWLVEGRFEET